MFKISFLNMVIKEEKNMTNCYCPKGIYDMYLGADPTKRFAERYRKMSKIYRLSLKVTVPLVHLVFPKIYKMESAMKSFQGKIHMMEYPEHRITYRVMRFMRIVCRIVKLEAPILAALTR